MCRKSRRSSLTGYPSAPRGVPRFPSPAYFALVCGSTYLKTAESGKNPGGCIRFWFPCDTCKVFKKKPCGKKHGAAGSGDEEAELNSE